MNIADYLWSKMVESDRVSEALKMPLLPNSWLHAWTRSIVAEFGTGKSDEILGYLAHLNLAKQTKPESDPIAKKIADVCVQISIGEAFAFPNESYGLRELRSCLATFSKQNGISIRKDGEGWLWEFDAGKHEIVVTFYLRKTPLSISYGVRIFPRGAPRAIRNTAYYFVPEMYHGCGVGCCDMLTGDREVLQLLNRLIEDCRFLTKSLKDWD